jgi:hypothetical protein
MDTTNYLQTNNTINIEELTKKYIELRDLKKQMEFVLEEKLKPLNEQMEKIELEIMRFLTTTGATSIKTKYGTPYCATVRSVTVDDSNKFFDFVKNNDAFDLLQKRVVSSVFDQYVEDGVEIPGVIVNSILRVKIKKS